MAEVAPTGAETLRLRGKSGLAKGHKGKGGNGAHAPSWSSRSCSRPCGAKRRPRARFGGLCKFRGHPRGQAHAKVTLQRVQPAFDGTELLGNENQCYDGRADVVLNVGDTAPLRSSGCCTRACGAYNPHGSPCPFGGGPVNGGGNPTCALHAGRLKRPGQRVSRAPQRASACECDLAARATNI